MRLLSDLALLLLRPGVVVSGLCVEFASKMSLSVSASSKAASKKAFYAVAKGRKRGIYSTWAKCEEQVLNSC